MKYIFGALGILAGLSLLGTAGGITAGTMGILEGLLWLIGDVAVIALSVWIVDKKSPAKKGETKTQIYDITPISKSQQVR